MWERFAEGISSLPLFMYFHVYHDITLKEKDYFTQSVLWWKGTCLIVFKIQGIVFLFCSFHPICFLCFPILDCWITLVGPCRPGDILRPSMCMHPNPPLRARRAGGLHSCARQLVTRAGALSSSASPDESIIPGVTPLAVAHRAVRLSSAVSASACQDQVLDKRSTSPRRERALHLDTPPDCPSPLLWGS